MKIVNWITSALGQKDDGGNRQPVPSLMSADEQENSIPEYIQKRRYPRFAVGHMGILSKAVISGGVQLSNISAGGACIVSRIPLGSGENVLMRIHRKKVHHPLMGTVIWEDREPRTHHGETVIPALCKAGIRFTAIDSDILTELKDYMHSHGLPDDKRPLSQGNQNTLRYILPGEEKAILHYLVMGEVKRISMGGMLIQTRNDLRIGNTYLFSLSLPDETVPLKFIGRIASRIPAADKKSSYDTGVEFRKLTEEDRKKLKRFIAGLLWKQKA